nr:hypothetical protein [uncultured Cohaesibacter sp.]
MNMSAPVERVVAFLKDANFRLLPPPFVISQTTFEFPAVMMGPGNASEIVLVCDTVDAKDAEIVRRIHGVARALDIARARNPLTAVLVGPRLNPDYLNKVMQVCRALSVGTVPAVPDETRTHLSNWLAVLTPLDQIDTDGVVADPMSTLETLIDDLSPEVKALSDQMSNGAEAVEAAVNELLSEHLTAAWGDDA